MRTLLTSAAIALLLAGGLTSCTEDEPRPKIAPATSATSEPAQQQTEEPETPEAFVERWLDEVDRLASTGDADSLIAMAHRCKKCVQSARSVEQFIASGGTAKGGRHTLVTARVDPCDLKNRTCVTADVEVEAGVDTAASGQVTRYPPGVLAYDITLIEVAGAWKVNNYFISELGDNQ